MKRTYLLAIPAFLAVSAATAAHPVSWSKGVDEALAANQRAHSYEDWVARGQMPNAVFEGIRAIEDANLRSAAWKELCEKLSRVGTVELALFSDEIDESAGDPGFTCRLELRYRINSFYEVQARYFNAGDGSDKDGGGSPFIPSKVKNETRELNAGLNPVVSPGFMVYGTNPPGKGAFMKKANLGPKEICLTFDDGPMPDRTLKVLDDLDAADVRVNFFEVGRNAQAHPELSAEAAHRGHVMGSHSMTHPILTDISFEAGKKQILDGSRAVAEASGELVPFFRFPGGGWNRALMKVTDEAGLASFFWDMDTRDWQIHDPSELYAKAVRELDRSGNGTILFHDTQPATWVIIPRFLNELAKRDYTVVQFKPKKIEDSASTHARE